MYQTVIVEDDPTITMLHRSFLKRDSRFSLARTFSNGQDALSWLLDHPVDLAILDVYMPRMSGAELLRALRSAGNNTDVIMITAANDIKTVDTLLKLGITDYLVKPFAALRFQQALDTFCQHKDAIAAQKTVSQTDLDAIFASASSPHPIPKGLQKQTLDLIRSCLSQLPQEGCTCEQIGELCGFSTVTVRHYLNYLVDLGEVATQVNYDTGGRPSLRYLPQSQV